MRAHIALLLASFLAPSATAQVLAANFDGASEGAFATTWTDGGVTFSNLDQAVPWPGPFNFAIEDASGDLTGQPGYTPSNVLGFGGYSPGPGTGFSRCKSFDVTWGGAPATTARFELWELGNPSTNTVTLQALLGTTVVASDTITFPGGFALHHFTLQVAAPSFDALHVVGGGSAESGAFFAVIDSVEVVVGSPVDEFCAGDGSGTACPCGNSSPLGLDEGCTSSLGVGARLRASGSPSLGNDTLVLAGSQMPNSSALYFQGTAQQGGGLGAAFGDGLRCAGGTIIRLGTKTNVAGVSQYPAGGDLPVATRGLVTTPGTRYYQVWYRNAAAFCTASTFNLSNGLEVQWGS